MTKPRALTYTQLYNKWKKVMLREGHYTKKEATEYAFKRWLEEHLHRW